MNVSNTVRKAGHALWKFRQSRAGFIVLWVLVMVFLGKAALDSYADYESMSLSIKWGLLGVSLLFIVVYNLVNPLKWMYMMNISGTPIGYLQTSRAFFLSQLSSFIPGGVWQYLDLGYRVSGRGKSVENIAYTTLYVHGADVGAAFFYAALMAAVYMPRYTAPAILMAAATLCGAVFSADIFGRLRNSLERLGANLGDYHPERRRLFTLFLVSLAVWPLSGAALFFLVASLTPVPLYMFVPISGIMAVAWAAGFMVLILPGGLGVREAVMVGALSQIVPMPVALAVTVLSRVTTLAVKISVAAVFGLAVDGED